MKRIDIIYNGAVFSIGDRELDELKSEIESAIVSGKPHWLRVNQGGGIPRATDLLITTATQIALTPIHEPQSEADSGAEDIPEDSLDAS